MVAGVGEWEQEEKQHTAARYAEPSTGVEQHGTHTVSHRDGVRRWGHRERERDRQTDRQTERERREGKGRKREGCENGGRYIFPVRLRRQSVSRTSLAEVMTYKV